MLPFLFLMSCLAMGYAVVVLEGMLSHYLLGRRLETEMLAKLARIIAPLQGAWIGLRLYDLLVRDDLALAFTASPYAALFWLEILLFALPAFMLASHERASHPATLFRAAGLLAFAGALYRFDTFLVAFQPGDHWSYFPSLGEITVTVGLVAMEILAYVAIIHYFPIMSGTRPATAAKAGM
jgi:Ni/Fe-hydrogenase subunit HybB-like protein